MRQKERIDSQKEIARDIIDDIEIELTFRLCAMLGMFSAKLVSSNM